MARGWPWEWFWSAADAAGARAYKTTRKEYGFIRVEEQATGTFEEKSVEDYRLEIQDDAKWRDLEATMASFFTTPLDLFPYDHEHQQRSSRKSDDWLRRWLEPIVGVHLPADYWQIQIQLIEARFPKAKIQGDAIRGYVSLLRYVYGKNLWNLILRRRRGAIITSILALSSFFIVANLPDPTQSQALRIAAYVFLATTAAWILLWMATRRNLSSEFENKVGESCTTVGSAVNQKFSDLDSRMSEISKEITGGMGSKRTPPEIHWAKDAERWAHLGYWMLIRAQYLEFYFQVEMWRMRRMQAWMRLIGYSVTAATMNASFVVLVLAAAGVFLGEAGLTRAVLLTVAALAFVILQVVLSQWAKSISRKHSLPPSPENEGKASAVDILVKTALHAELLVALSVFVAWIGSRFGQVQLALDHHLLVGMAAVGIGWLLFDANLISYVWNLTDRDLIEKKLGTIRGFKNSKALDITAGTVAQLIRTFFESRKIGAQQAAHNG